ncbi:MAG TPA: TetR/AcrR family transcriptional regulator [Terracidiphilus sp.]|nr:TetR/AcrR family transcriptional regulator [Terracidiphilus sp.]
MARTRSTEAHEKVLKAALSLFGERGIDGTSMDAIAQASGVSKATIYKHWKDKESILLEVMDRIHGLDRERRDVDTGDLLQDLIWILTQRPPDEFEDARAKLTPSLIAYSAIHQEFGAAWRRRVMQPGREAIENIVRRGVKQGMLRDVDTETAVALLMGPMLFNHIFQRDKKAAKPELGPAVAESFWRAYSSARKERLETAGYKKESKR